MPNSTVNKVEYGGQTIIDITDTTADAVDVIEGEVFYAKSGARSVGTLTDATQSTHGLMSTSDKIKLDGINLLGIKLSTTALTPDNNGIVTIPLMTGATSSTDGTAGLIPAPTSADYQKFFRGDGTWQDGGRPMVILSYGTSTWADFETAYNNNVIVYCRASSNSNPASGSQTRMAFMAYVNNATSPTEVEFQYYRSMSSHSATAMGDQVFVYKLNKNNGWSVTTRDASIKEINVASGSKLEVSWSSNKVTLSNTMTADDMPMSSSDATTTKTAIEGKADLVSSATSGNFAGLDSNGNLTDSGSKASDFLTQHQDISGKADKVSSATSGNFAGLDSNGNLTDSGSKASDFLTRPNITVSDNRKVMEVVNGGWAVGTEKIDKQVIEGFKEKTWPFEQFPNGLTAGNVWTDGENIYYSEFDLHYIYNKSTSTWSEKTWYDEDNNNIELLGENIWLFGENVFYSYYDEQYVLDKSTSTWITIEWQHQFNEELAYPNPHITLWFDNDKCYMNEGGTPFELHTDGVNYTVSEKTWYGLPSNSEFFESSLGIWSDGNNIYFSDGNEQYVLNSNTSTWSSKTWYGFTNFWGRYIWHDGDTIYFSNGSSQYKLDKLTSTWSAVSWPGYAPNNGERIWSDGNKIYYSYEINQYELDSINNRILLGQNNEWTPTSLSEATAPVIAPLNDAIQANTNAITANTGAIAGKADKVSSATNGNFAGLDANGNITDSGHKHSDYLTEHQDISGKADKADTVLDTTLSRGRKENTTVGLGSFAFGYDVTSTGNYGHAEGYETIANGLYSHSEGNNTASYRKSQHVSGEFNALDISTTGTLLTRGDYVELVGNGTATGARSNARALDWNGNEYLAGDVYINCDANSTNGTALGAAVTTINNKIIGQMKYIGSLGNGVYATLSDLSTYLKNTYGNSFSVAFWAQGFTDGTPSGFFLAWYDSSISTNLRYICTNNAAAVNLTYPYNGVEQTITAANNTALVGTKWGRGSTCTGLPSSNASEYYKVLAFGNFQIAMAYGGNDGVKDIFVREYTNSQWYPWTCMTPARVWTRAITASVSITASWAYTGKSFTLTRPSAVRAHLNYNNNAPGGIAISASSSSLDGYIAGAPASTTYVANGVLPPGTYYVWAKTASGSGSNNIIIDTMKL